MLLFAEKLTPSEASKNIIHESKENALFLLPTVVLLDIRGNKKSKAIIIVLITSLFNKDREKVSSYEEVIGFLNKPLDKNQLEEIM